MNNTNYGFSNQLDVAEYNAKWQVRYYHQSMIHLAESFFAETRAKKITVDQVKSFLADRRKRDVRHPRAFLGVVKQGWGSIVQGKSGVSLGDRLHIITNKLPDMEMRQTMTSIEAIERSILGNPYMVSLIENTLCGYLQNQENAEEAIISLAHEFKKFIAKNLEGQKEKPKRMVALPLFLDLLDPEFAKNHFEEFLIHMHFRNRNGETLQFERYLLHSAIDAMQLYGVMEAKNQERDQQSFAAYLSLNTTRVTKGYGDRELSGRLRAEKFLARLGYKRVEKKLKNFHE